MSTNRPSSIISHPSSSVISRPFLVFYRGIDSTYVERTLQIRPFLCKTNPIFPIFRLKMMISLKNKANSNPIAKRPKMNVNICYTKTYKNKTAFRRNKNKANSKPKQTQLANWAEINISSFMTSKYEKIDRWRG
jgi:hypothetical protein